MHPAKLILDELASIRMVASATMSFGGELTLWPIQAAVADGAAAIVEAFDDAFAAGRVVVAELEVPSVGHLEFRNRSELPVFVQPGTLVRGGGQNRMVLAPHLLAPMSTATLPVHCVERGRWNPHGGAAFTGRASSPYAFRVASTRVAMDGTANQSETWGRVRRRVVSSGVTSHTESLLDALPAQEPIAAPDGAGGVVADAGGRARTVAFSGVAALGRAAIRSLHEGLLAEAPGGVSPAAVAVDVAGLVAAAQREEDWQETSEGELVVLVLRSPT